MLTKVSQPHQSCSSQIQMAHKGHILGIKCLVPMHRAAGVIRPIDSCWICGPEDGKRQAKSITRGVNPHSDVLQMDRLLKRGKRLCWCAATVQELLDLRNIYRVVVIEGTFTIQSHNSKICYASCLLSLYSQVGCKYSASKTMTEVHNKAQSGALHLQTYHARR